ncbi:MAG: Do family serine endopeptidase [Arenimonas sp.]|nr:Do family serine endopeptidase [Arenimonas sp.]MBP6309422.1 Do family serine endopeptidase [Arenimonas sp.]
MQSISNAPRFLLGFFSCVVLVACWQQTQQPVQAQTTSATTSTVPIALPDFSALVERTSPAVVSVEATMGSTNASKELGQNPNQDEQMQEFFKRYFGQPGPGSPAPQKPRQGTSFGSGFIISTDGYVLTNHHVIEGSDKVVIHLADRREIVAEVIGSDASTDVAVLKIKATNLPVLTIGNSQIVKPGQWVVAIGSPFGFDHSVTAGIISALGRPSIDGSQRYVPFIQSDVAINQGNSGGPLLNTRGEVIGINSQIFSNSGGYMGLSFAIPIKVAMNAVEQIKSTGSVERGQLGVQVRDVQNEEITETGLKVAEGAFVASVQNGSPAAIAGIKPGDIITTFNGQKIINSSDLPPLVGALMPGAKAQVNVLRNGQQKSYSVVLTALNENLATAQAKPIAKPEAANVSKLGFSIAEVSPKTRSALGVPSGGVEIVQIIQPMLGQMGINKGDVILQVGRQVINSPSDFNKALSSAKSGDQIRLLIQNAQSTGIYVLEMP